MTKYEQLGQALRATPATWLVTGVAGFIGSNLAEALLKLNQRVVGLDNFAGGHQRNLDQVRALVGESLWSRFSFLEGDIRSLDLCCQACQGADYVLHQGALGSVPRSIEDPLAFHENNTTGTLNMLQAARRQKVKRFVYASSSSVYGDDATLPKVEDRIGAQLSPYAATKLANEIYAGVFSQCYTLPSIGLRYFNVFGPRQDPNGAYAAVIPKWLTSMLQQEPVFINGDGETSRDFCFVANVVQANLLAATTQNPAALNQAYNVAVGDRTTLNQLFNTLRAQLQAARPGLVIPPPQYRDFRAGDIRHSLADISMITDRLGFHPTHRLAEGLEASLGWYLANPA